jgi:hypothetical protein
LLGELIVLRPAPRSGLAFAVFLAASFARRCRYPGGPPSAASVASGGFAGQD